MEVTFKIDEAQLRRLTEMLREFPDDVIAERRVVGGMKKALKPTLQAARKEVTFRNGAGASFGAKSFKQGSAGNTAKALHVVRGRRSRQESPYVVLRLRNKPGDNNPRRYQHIVIRGTHGGVRESAKGFVLFGDDGRARRIKKINHPGTEANPYIDEAWAQTYNQVVNGFVDAVAKDIKMFKRRHGMK